MTTKAVAAPAASAVAPTTVMTFEHMKQLAKSMAASKLFGVKTEDEALSLMMISQAEGRHPGLAVRDYHIIQGRPSLKADTMLARFQAAGGSVNWTKYTDTEVVGVFSHPQAGSVTVDWSIERARGVKSWDKEKNAMVPLTDKLVWKNYPRAMLRARCIGEGVRTCFPGIAVGVYTPEEIEAIDTEIDITPSKSDTKMQDSVEGAVNALTKEEIEEHINAMDVKTLPELKAAFEAAWAHANTARDKAARDRFQQAYDLRKADIAGPAQGSTI